MDEDSGTKKIRTEDLNQERLSNDQIDSLADLISDAERNQDAGNVPATDQDDTGEFEPVR